MSDGASRPAQTRKFSWSSLGRRDSYREARQNENALETPQEGKEIQVYRSRPLRTGSKDTTEATSSPVSAPTSRSSSLVSSGRESVASSTSNPTPSPTTHSRSLSRTTSSGSLTTVLNGTTDPTRFPQQSHELTRVDSSPSQSRPPSTPTVQPPTPNTPAHTRSHGSFSKMSLTAMIDALRGRDSEDRGRSVRKEKERESIKSASVSRPASIGGNSRGGPPEDRASRARSYSPFRRRNRSRSRASASVEALQLDDQSDTESQHSSIRRPSVRPRNAFNSFDDEESEPDNDNDDGEDSGWSSADEYDYEDDDDGFDPETLANTEQNSIIPEQADSLAEVPDPDPLGEGVNVIVPPEPFFPTSVMAVNTGATSGSTTRNPRRRKSTRHAEPELELKTGRPVFQRDRCTITLTHGHPEVAQAGGRRAKRYVTASDLSLESRYAIEWAVGTVLRDGDELYIVNVVETDTKLDPPTGATIDRANKVRNQQERQALSYILVRQVTGLLQRTRLNVTVVCQAWHAKNARHMLLDVVDYLEPAMLIVGSRGLGQIKGILLGSTSHYLIQKATVPVMVARRRLRRPPKRVAHLSTHRARVSLAEAAIDKVAPRVDADVANMRTEMEKEERDEWRNAEDREEENEEEENGGHSVIGRKVSGSPTHG